MVWEKSMSVVVAMMICFVLIGDAKVAKCPGERGLVEMCQIVEKYGVSQWTRANFRAKLVLLSET